MRTFLTVILLLSFFWPKLRAQTPAGQSSTYYAGVQGAARNPAYGVLSPFAADINLVSANVGVGSDFVAINLGGIDDFAEGFEFDDDVNTTPTDNNNLFVHAEAFLPSFVFRASPKSSVGLLLRARGMSNVNRINGNLFQEISDELESDEARDYEAMITDLNANTHVWAEAGLNYSYLAVDSERLKLSVGATLKLLRGAGGAFFSSPMIDASYNDETELITSTGTLSYGSTVDFDDDDISFDRLTSGLGFDLGASVAIMEPGSMHPKFRAGLSVTDIGGIGYEDVSVEAYDLEGVVHTDEFDEDIEQSLQNNYAFTSRQEDITISLPTALHGFAELRLQQRIFLAAEASVSLLDNRDARATTLQNYFAIIPRIEGKGLGIYSPIGTYQYSGFDWGLGFKAGPLHFGSNTLLSSILGSDTRQANVYAALKLSFHRKDKQKQEAKRARKKAKQKDGD